MLHIVYIFHPNKNISSNYVKIPVREFPFCLKRFQKIKFHTFVAIALRMHRIYYVHVLVMVVQIWYVALMNVNEV